MNPNLEARVCYTKITSQLVEVKNTRDFVVLGNLDAVRDWGMLLTM